MDNAFKNYDRWKLSDPYDNEGPEIFETEKFRYYHTNEELVNEFDYLLKKQIDSGIDDESLEEIAEEIADELGLFTDEYKALEVFKENEQSEREYYLEQKYEYLKDLKNE